ncbi:hypothetical protein [Photobacterium damselae]|uniref:hypothetical protein n=1 Tax=Photobacterium damselae TaxID=38293 RepID=UPI002F42B790
MSIDLSQVQLLTINQIRQSDLSELHIKYGHIPRASIDLSQINLESMNNTIFSNMKSACSYFSADKNNLKTLITISDSTGNSLKDVIQKGIDNEQNNTN